MIISDVLGTIVCHQDGTPNTEKFFFVVSGLDLQKEQTPVHVGQYVSIQTDEGLIIAHVEQVQKTNRYFAQVDAVTDFTRTGKPFSGIFPVDRWEYLLAEAKPLGLFKEGEVQRLTYPPSPGAQVRTPDPKILAEFLGFAAQGIHLGSLLFHNIPATFNLTRMFQKHVALLAMSGAGKSYTAAVMIEELLLRKSRDGRPAVIILDVHGEYSGLEESHSSSKVSFQDKITVIRSPLVELATPKLNSVDFARYSPEMSGIQIRELTRIIRTLRKARKGKTYNLDDIMSAVENDPSGNVRTREALLGWLENLRRLQLFGKTSTPNWPKIMVPGKAIILDMSDTISLQKKQIIAAEVLRQLFYLRRENQIPPTIVLVEEAHQFCLSEDTEILTNKGWKNYSEIEIGELAFSYNCESEMLELHRIENIILREHDGEMIKVANGKSIEALVTKDHRVLCNYRTTGRDRQWCWSENKFVFAKNLPSGFRIPLAAEQSSETNCDIDEDLIKILGWIITDGNIHYFDNKAYYSYEISQSSAKGEILAQMNAVIKRRFPEVSVYTRLRPDPVFQRREEHTFYLKSAASKEINSWLQYEAHRIPRQFLEKASLHQLKVLFVAMVQGDGHIQRLNNGFKYVVFYAGKNQGLADDFQELCVRIGLSAIQKVVPQNNQIKVLVSFKRKYAHIRRATTEHYSGRVWDITIRNGAFVARRNGKVFFTGNCPEARRGLAYSKGILETVAREGRKYNLALALISQRPVRLSTTVLSQCGTNIFLRITNPYDLDHLKSSSEQITKSTLASISSLSVGEALVVGQGTRFPVFIKVRPRITKETGFGDDFETVAKRFDRKME